MKPWELPSLPHSVGSQLHLFSFLQLSLQQNEVVNNYEDAYKNGDDEGETFGQSTDENIQEAFSLIDRDKSVQCIEYHPVPEGLVGMAACERGDFDER